MGTAAKDLPDDTIPEVSVEDTLEWLDSQETRGRAAVTRLVNQAAAEAAGELVPGAFDPKELATLKRAVGLVVRARAALIGLVGAAHGVPATDVDEQFFAIVSASRGRDVTRAASDLSQYPLGTELDITLRGEVGLEDASATAPANGPRVIRVQKAWEKGWGIAYNEKHLRDNDFVVAIEKSEGAA